jgi:hypothetical protein
VQSGISEIMTTYTVQQLLQEYTFQRQQGVPPNSALQFLARLDPGSPQEKRRELAQWIRKWELEREYKPVSSYGQKSAPDKIICGNCRAENPGDGKYCYSCGNLLLLGPPSGNTEQLVLDETDPAMFGNLATLLIAVREHDDNPMRVKVGDDPIIVGRSDETRSGNAPGIDLAPFDAKNLGVSRSHAVLQRKDNTITLTDQGSVNHTYINGERIHPHEVRVIRDGDELRFGKLSTRVTFYRELRRLS